MNFWNLPVSAQLLNRFLTATNSGTTKIRAESTSGLQTWLVVFQLANSSVQPPGFPAMESLETPTSYVPSQRHGWSFPPENRKSL